MKKILVMLALMTAVGLASFLPQEILYDDCADISDWTNPSAGWTGGETTGAINVSSCYNVNTGAAVEYLYRTVGTVENYNNVNISFSVITAGLDLGEWVRFAWWNGSVWNQTMWVTVDYIYNYSFMVNVPDGNSLKLNFSANSSANTEKIWVDDIRVRGTRRDGVVNITYQTPLNGSSTVLDQNALFNVTVNFTCIGGQCGDVNATLKYNATASYPNANVDTTVGGSPFFISKSYPIRPVSYLVGGSGGGTYNTPEYGWDKYMNDTSTASRPEQTTAGDVANLTYTFNSISPGYRLFFTWNNTGGGAGGSSYITIWNYTAGAWKTYWGGGSLGESTKTNTTLVLADYISSGTVMVMFQCTMGIVQQRLTVSDIHIVSSSNGTNPLFCNGMARGDNCSVTWQVNATRDSGNYWLNVTFNQETGAQNSTSPNFQINTTGAADNTAPSISNFLFNVTNNTNYSSTQGYQFNATVSDTTSISYVWVEHNLSGTLTNYTATGNVGSSYYYNYGKLAAGFYFLKWYANDSSSNHNLNNTDWVHYYQVNKSYLPLTLYINGTNGDKTLSNNSNANFTANFSSSYSFNITLYTNLTGSWAIWDNKASPLMNYTVLNPYQARTYLIIANFSNQNYTYTQANHTLTLNNYGWLNISYQSPASGSGQNVTANTTFNVTMNITCVGGTCGAVTGVLRYSAGLNPNMNVSTITGATPFYTGASWLETNISDLPVAIYAVAIGDADNDGSDEVVVGLDPTTNEVRMYKNVSGGWVETNIADLPNYVTAVAIGDANNDGQNDVVVGMGFSVNELRMYENKTGTWVETVIKNEGVDVYSVAIGDANNDSQNEVVVGLGSTTNEVRMYNYTGGAWVETNIADLLDMVYSVAIGDVNNNGRNEVVIATWAAANEVRMYENVSGGWTETNIADTPTYVYAVAIGDANNDGQNETVIVMSNTTNEVRMYKNVSGGWVETNIKDEPTNTYAVAIGDANNDGQNEVAVGMWAITNEVRMYANRTGAWVETNISDEPNDVYAIAIGDANNNGLNEIVVGMLVTTNNLRMYGAISNPLPCGSLLSGQTCTVSWTVNATGTIGTQYWLDVNFTSNNGNVPANDSGNFQINITMAPVQYGWLNVSYQSPASGNSQNVLQNRTFNVTVNVTCVGGTCGNVTGVLRYNASAGLSPDTNISLTTGATPFFIPSARKTNVYCPASGLNSVAIGDPDNDGVTEFVSGGQPSCTKACLGEISIYNKVGGVWDDYEIDWLSIVFNSVAIGDADNNGKEEVVAGSNAGSKQVNMFVNESGDWRKYNLTENAGAYVYSVAIGDADNDGYNEVVAGAGSAANNETKMYENVSSTVWAGYNISEVGTTVWSVAIGDADNDGQNEVVIGTNTGTDEVRMYNYSGGAWVETNIKDTPNNVYSVAIGDADNDGQNEIVIGMEATSITNEVRMYKNVSGGWVETNISDGPDYGVYSVAIGDADNDGQNEVMIGIYTTVYEVRMYENVSGGWVETNISDGAGSIYGVAIGDVNGYGLNSVVVGGGSPTSVSVLDVQSNPISCDGMSAGEKCYVTWTVNATGPQETQYWLDVNFTSDKPQVPANDSGDFQINIATPSTLGILNITLIKPESNISVFKNRIFTMGARIACVGEAGANCYQSWAYSEYNATGQVPWYPTSTAEGETPFFIAGTYTELSRDNANTILRMHMDNTGSDSATSVYDETNKNNGTKLGDGSPAWSDGRFDAGLSFDGSDDYFNVSTISALNAYDKNLTIEFWFRPNQSTFQNGNTILARNWDDTGNNSFWIFFWNNPGPKLHFSTTTGSGINDLEGTNSNWVPGKWYHVAATFNGSRAALYINGSLDNAVNYAYSSINKSNNVLIVGAKNQWMGAGAFNGSIDELAIYNRTKNASEIAQDYKSDEVSCSLMTRYESCKIVWAINATGTVLTDWAFDIYTYPSNYSMSDNYSPVFSVGIAPITGCGQYIDCAYPNCAFYRDTTTTVQTTDTRQKVWSTIRTCWS